MRENIIQPKGKTTPPMRRKQIRTLILSQLNIWINSIRTALGMRRVTIHTQAPVISQDPKSGSEEDPGTVINILPYIGAGLLLAGLIVLVFWGFGKLSKSPTDMFGSVSSGNIEAPPNRPVVDNSSSGTEQKSTGTKSENLQIITDAFKQSYNQVENKNPGKKTENALASAAQGNASTTEYAIAVAYLLSQNDIAGAEKIIKVLQTTNKSKNAARKINMLYLAGLMKQNHTQQALDGIYQYIAAYGDGPAIAGFEGQVLLVSKNTKKAQAALKRSIELGLSNPQVPLTLADIYWKNKRKSQAISVLKDGIRNYPRSAALNVVQGVMYQQERNYEAAKTAYQTALDKEVNNWMALNNISWLLAVEMKDPAAALKYAEQLNALKPKSSGLLDTVGWVFHLNGKSKDALPLLEAAMQKSGGNDEIRQHYEAVKKAAGF